MAGFTEISPAALARRIGAPDQPTLVDVCTDEDFACDPRVIPTARRVRHGDLDTLAAIAAARDVVVICQKGKKLSHGVAAALRARGVRAQVLAGGIHGWRDAGLPLTAYDAIPASPLWVTRHRPKIDRIACPWLIRRFIQPEAQVLYVPPAEVLAVADRFDATAFDASHAPFADGDGRCTFDALLDAFDLRFDGLADLARVIRAADTDALDAVPEAAGLHALSVGLSRLHRDDTAQLEAGLPIYDALFRWARDGQGEGHAHVETKGHSGSHGRGS